MAKQKENTEREDRIKLELLGMAPENECQREMFAMIPWGKRELAVPLSQLKPVHGTAETTEALEDVKSSVEFNSSALGIG